MAIASCANWSWVHPQYGPVVAREQEQGERATQDDETENEPHGTAGAGMRAG